MQTAIYIRVSTEEQARDGFSISAQREKLKSYCHLHDMDNYKFYVDEGISAKDTNRPQLQALLKHIEEGHIDTVLVYRLDRLTRSVVDLYKLLETFDKYNCAFKSATEVYDTSSAIGRLFITLVAAMAQWERENLGERVRMGQIEKARQGEYAAKAPYGFEKDENDKLIINEREETVILDIIKKIKSGDSIRKLANELEESGIPPIRGYKWHIATILDILHNPALYGALKWRDEIIEGTHEGIVSKEEFEHIQQLLHSRQNFKKRKTYSIFIYQMTIVCPTCGNRLSSERSKYYRKRDKKYIESNHYRCQACVLNKRKATAVSEKKIEKAFLEYMNSFQFYVSANQTAATAEPDEREKIISEIKRVERQREKYQRAWSKDWVTDEEFSERMKETQAELEELQMQLKQVQPAEKEHALLNGEKLKAIVNDFKLNWGKLNPVQKKEFIQTFIKEIHFSKTNGKATVLSVQFYL
ncbi:recombinase family protein [Bacillus tianshenii]|nr:recombinase family protein [Bacillus tianshenii]